MEKHSETCPICKGSGITIIHDVQKDEEKTCIGCSGQGWIEVSGSADEQVINPDERLLCEVPQYQLELQLNG